MRDKQQPEKMAGESLDISEQRRNELKQLFPGVFTETTGKDNQLVETIDFERLKAELGTFSDIYVGRRERYGMEWPGKRDCMKLIQEPSRATLKPCREESVDFDTTQNLFIEGDNLEVLKLLQKAYYGKVKMIYIDPPYNTGKEFIYPDNYTESLETYLAYAGLIDDEGKKFSTNTAAEGRFHTKWLNMMYPRLYLARNLLREDGVIFISIDDNEMENLRRMCDELFGEENFIENFIWKKSYGGGPKERFAVTQHEYVLMYARNKDDMEPFWLSYDPTKIDRYYKYKDDKYDLRGPYRIKPLEATKSMDARPNLVYEIPSPQGGVISPKRQWLWSKERVLNALSKDNLVFTGDGKNQTANYKQYLRDEEGVERGEKPFSIIDGIYTQRGTDDIRSLFEDKVVIQFPKPVDLISKFVAIACTNDKDAIVLDFFAGSATTAHAVYKTNVAEQNTNSFLLVQLPEPCDKDSTAYKSGFSTITDIAKHRIRRAAEQIRQGQEGQLSLKGNCEPDLGFKVLKLDKSNFKQWQSFPEGLDVEQLSKQLVLHTDYIDHEAAQEDIFYELLLKAGFMPTEKIETLTLADKQVFSIAEGALLICLEEELTSELIDAVADREPMQFICLDKGFKGNDQLKANAVQTFKSRSRSAETEMAFKVA
jgi:adenine-specific DNA-methyltransferase